MSAPRRIYLSSSLANARLNARLREVLPAARYELVLPQEFSPLERTHARFPRAIYERCIEEMEACDLALILLDAFGVDCASEAGWLCARQKPLVGVAMANTRFLQHWMIKGNLSGVVSLDACVHAEVAEDPILRDVPTVLSEGWSGLAQGLETVWERLAPVERIRR
ncbi:MAG: nucleoside 2-deoxyribosyltransferase [Planctomycetota bacterium]